MTVVEPKYEMDPTSLSPMGDDFSPATGTVTFSATDISIPGNFAIPVALQRWVPSDDSDTGGPSGWKWNIPFIRGNYLDVKDGHSTTGWNWGNEAIIWRNGKNCTGDADSVIDNNGGLVAANAYWQGKLLHIPGVTSETFLVGPNGKQLTKSHFEIIGCVDNNAPDPKGIIQQGIVVRGPDGTTYTFNQIKDYYNGKSALKDPIVRTRLLMISTIKDRFNNEVTYHYDAAGNLTGISASDGREITISYQNGQVYQASAHGRTWTYGEGSVTLPDGRQWSYTGLSALAFKPNGIGGYNQEIRLNTIPTTVPNCGVAAGDYLVTIVSPDGLQTNYTFRDTIHYRSDVEPDIYNDRSSDYALSRALYCTVKRSLVSKTSSGAGVGPYTWTFTYSGNHGTYKESSIPRSWLTGPFDLAAPVGGYPAPVAAGGAEHFRSVTVSGPDKRSVFYIDRRFQSISEERVVAQDTLNAAGTQLLERSDSSFALGAEVGMHWYMCPCEGVYPPINEGQSTHHVNQTQDRKIRYVGNSADATFTTALSDFDTRGRSRTAIRSGTVGAPSRTERTVYDQDHAGLGVVGQLKTLSVDGISAPMVEHTYDPGTALRTSTKKFGILQANYEYHGDGNLWKYIDGRNQATVFTDYRRGRPQRIDRPNSTFEKADINDWGLLTGRTDLNGNLWSYGYDDALRLDSITPPTGWAGTSITYERAGGSEYGLPAGHWRQTVDKGNARTITYFDVLWRPLMVRSYDTGSEASTRKVAVKTFDVAGQLVFESFPQRDLATIAISSPGRRMQYDALGRATRLESDSDKGVLVTTTEYVSGFKTRVTNPRSKVTTQSMWAQDDPNQAVLGDITAPEGINVKITRNLLGNPTSIRRWGTANGVSADVTRSYVYDAG
ncbi:MAG: Rhs family protein, partial [Pseudoduganella sp.]|nr:Rhs family protein [Pseudoduganella sp.]